VIGGDEHYTDEDERDRTVISRWARRKVASQFDEEYLDGRKSFIFSWNKQHREIHEEALLHYFDPRKKGQKFEYQPKPKLVPMPKPEEPKITSPAVKDIQREVELYTTIFLLVNSLKFQPFECLFLCQFLIFFFCLMPPTDHV